MPWYCLYCICCITRTYLNRRSLLFYRDRGMSTLHELLDLVTRRAAVVRTAPPISHFIQLEIDRLKALAFYADLARRSGVGYAWIAAHLCAREAFPWPDV